MSEDIVSRFIQIVAEVLPSASEADRDVIERQIRKEFGGSREYIQKRPANLHQRIRQQFTGNNISRLATALDVSPRTVRRALDNGPAT